MRRIGFPSLIGLGLCGLCNLEFLEVSYNQFQVGLWSLSKIPPWIAVSELDRGSMWTRMANHQLYWTGIRECKGGSQWRICFRIPLAFSTLWPKSHRMKTWILLLETRSSYTRPFSSLTLPRLSLSWLSPVRVCTARSSTSSTQIPSSTTLASWVRITMVYHSIIRISRFLFDGGGDSLVEVHSHVSHSSNQEDIRNRTSQVFRELKYMWMGTFRNEKYSVRPCSITDSSSSVITLFVFILILFTMFWDLTRDKDNSR